MRIDFLHAGVALAGGLCVFILPAAGASAGGVNRVAEASKPSGYPVQRASTKRPRASGVGGRVGSAYGKVAAGSLRYGGSRFRSEHVVAGVGYAGDPYDGGAGYAGGAGGGDLFGAGGLFGPGTGPDFGGHAYGMPPYGSPTYAVPTTVYQPVTRTYTVPVRSFRTIERTRYVPVTSYRPVTTAVQVPVTTYQTFQRTEQVPTLAYKQVCPPCNGCGFGE